MPVGRESFLLGAAKYSSLKKSLKVLSLIVKGTLFGCLSEKALGTHLYFLADENSSGSQVPIVSGSGPWGEWRKVLSKLGLTTNLSFLKESFEWSKL